MSLSIDFKINFKQTRVVGVARFELTREGVKVPCLTAWLHPSVSLFESGAFEEIRTPDPRLRRAMLYPTELQTHIMERVMGIGPTQPAWKAGTLPLSYTRSLLNDITILFCCQLLIFIFYNFLHFIFISFHHKKIFF